MFSFVDYLDRATIAGLSTTVGLTVGAGLAGLTTLITNYIRDVEVDKEKRKRSLIASKDLIRHAKTADEYNITATYQKRLKTLLDAIHENYGESKRNDFEKLLTMYAFPVPSSELNSQNEEMLLLHDLSQSLMKHHAGRSSGVDQSIIEIFHGYSQKNKMNETGMDSCLAVMRILQNIILLYRGFLAENKMIPEDISPFVENKEEKRAKPGRLEAVNHAMESFLSDLVNTRMFRDGGASFVQVKETARQMNLPKVVTIVRDMGKEAVNFQKKLTILDRVNEKFWKIWEQAHYFSQAIERMSSPIYYLPGLDLYTSYKRKDGVIEYNISSNQDHVSAEDDMVANVVTRHMQAAYAAFFSDDVKKRGENFSHLVYLASVRKNKSIKNEKIYLPSVAKISSGKFDQPLQEQDVARVMPCLDRYYTYIYAAAAMQADLILRLGFDGNRGFMRSEELQYYFQLIDAFIRKAEKIASEEIFGKETYFRKFIERLNDNAFFQNALNLDKSAFYVYRNGINIIDEDSESQFGVTENKVFGVSLNHMLHAESLRKAADEIYAMERIDAQMAQLTRNSGMEGESVSCDGVHESGWIDHDFLYQVALLTYRDHSMKAAIKEIKSPLKDKKILDSYIDRLMAIEVSMNSMFANYYFPVQNISPWLVDVVRIGTRYRSEFYDVGSDYYQHLRMFMSEFSESENSFFSINEEGHYRIVSMELYNRGMVAELKRKIVAFVEMCNKSLLSFKLKSVERDEKAFLASLVRKFNRLLGEIDALNKKNEVHHKNLSHVSQEAEQPGGKREKLKSPSNNGFGTVVQENEEDSDFLASGCQSVNHHLAMLMQSCRELVREMNAEHKERLLGEGYCGELKWKAIASLTEKINDENIDPHVFFNVFKAILIVYLQNKTGNTWYRHTKTTTMGECLIPKLNTPRFSMIKNMVFGSCHTVSYLQLACSLQKIEEAVAMVSELIQPENGELILTIDRFSHPDFHLSSQMLGLLVWNSKLERKRQNLSISKGTSIPDEISSASIHSLSRTASDAI